MPRTSPVHYIAPSSISITPNANDSANDLAVYVGAGTKIRVFSSGIPELGFINNTYQEWTLAGRNRRLADPASENNEQYWREFTIYARLSKTDKNIGYLVFAPKLRTDDGWIDKYPYVTMSGLAEGTAEYDTGNYWYIRLGYVTVPMGAAQRTVYLDTGILGTDQYNSEWILNPDDVLRVQLTPYLGGENAGNTPYVPWNSSLQLHAELLGQRETDPVAFHHWGIVRNIGYTSEADFLDRERSEYFAEWGDVFLSHLRNEASDDFKGAVSVTFVITAYGRSSSSGGGDDSGGDEYNEYNGGEDEGGEEEYEAIASASITVMPETAEKYELDLSTHIVNYSQEYGFEPENVVIHVRGIDQSGTMTMLSSSQIEGSHLSLEYALSNDGVFIGGALPFAPDSEEDPDGPASARVGTVILSAGQNVTVRLMMIESAPAPDPEGEDEGDDYQYDTVTTMKELARATILNYYNLNSNYVTVAWFNRLFKVHGTPLLPDVQDGDGDEDEGGGSEQTDDTVQPNDMQSEITDVESIFGLWTQQFLSALGIGDQAAGGGSGVLMEPLLSINESLLGTPPYGGEGKVAIVYNYDTAQYEWGETGGGGGSIAQNNIVLHDYNGPIEPTTLGDYDHYYLYDKFLSLGYGGTITSSVAISDAYLSVFHPEVFHPLYAQDHHVLNKGEIITLGDSRYVTKEFFDSLFRAQDASGDVDVNDTLATITSIKAMFGFWTEQYLSALGQNDAGGSGGATIYGLDLNGRTLSIVRDSTQTSITLPDTGLDASQVTDLIENYLDDHNYINDLSDFTWWGNTFPGGSSAITGDIAGTGNITPLTGNDPYDIGSLVKSYRALYIDEIHIGDAVISWDANNRGIHITKGLYSDEWVSALGANPSGGSGSTVLYGLDLNGTTLTLTTNPQQMSVDLSGIGVDTTRVTQIVNQILDGKNYLTDLSGFSWWGRQTDSNGIVTGDITLGSGDALKWKAATGSGTYSMISMDNSGQRKQFSLGTLEVPCDTTLTGSTLTLQSGTTAAIHSASLAADGVFTVEKLRIGTIVISHDTIHGGLHVESAGLYADNYLSALGANDQGGSGSSVLYGLQLSGSSLSLMPNGSSQSVDLADTLVTLSSSQNISGIKKFGSIHANTTYFGWDDQDVYLNRNGNNLILQNNHSSGSAGKIILASYANEPTYRKLGSGGNVDHLLLHSGSLVLDSSSNLTGITVGGTTYNISGGGGGATLGSILDNINNHSPNSFGVTSNSLLYYNSSENLWGTRAFSDFVTVSDAQTITGGKTFTAANTFSGTNTFNAAVTIGQDGSISSYNGFVKSNIVGASTNEERDAYVLLAGGGHVALSSIGGGSVNSIRLTSGGTSLTPSSGVITFPAAKTTDYGIIKVHQQYGQAASVQALGTASNRNYGLQIDTNGKAFVNVPWENDNDDTKNTAGSTEQASTKLYLVGAKSQAANPQTYSNAKCYIGTDNCLYSNNTKVLTEHQSLSDYVTLGGAQTITGAKTFKANVVVGATGSSNAKDLTVYGKLYVNGTPPSGNTPQAYVNGGTYLNGVTQIDGNLSILNSKNLTVTGNASVNGTLTVGTFSITNLSVSGTSSLTGSVGIGVSVDSNYSLKVNNKTRLETLEVNGAPATGVSAKLYVNGATYLNGATTINNSLTIPGSYNLNANGSVGIGTSASSSYKLYVNGTSYFTNTLNIAGTVADLSSHPSYSSFSNAKFYVKGNAVVNGTIYVGSTVNISDMRLKNVTEMVDCDVEDIARAPIFNFTWKGIIDEEEHLGTSAQYWRNVLPKAVVGTDGLAQDYGATALASAVITARKVMTHEEEIAALQKRVDAVEKENEWLRQEIEQLKAA